MTPELSRALLEAAQGLAERMRLFKRTAQQARERGAELVELQAAELWEAGDDAALEAFEAAHAEFTGQRPLPFQEAC